MRCLTLYSGYGVALTGLLTLIAGCTENGSLRGARLERATRDAAGRILPNTTLDEARPIAERVFHTRFRVDREQSSANVLVSRPTEVDQAGASGRVRDALRPSSNRHRYLAVLQLAADGPNVTLRCNVRLQRLDTTERAMFATARGDDRPDDTPIDRQGSTSVSTREEWVDVRRDKMLEQEILDAIEQELTGPVEPEPAPGA